MPDPERPAGNGVADAVGTGAPRSTTDPSAPPARPSTAKRLVKAAGLLVALVAVGLCVRALVGQWSEIRTSIEHANLALIVLGLVCAGGSMAGLGVLWWRCLAVFGHRVRLTEALSWYFGGELGKYLPGGVWSVLGRGELAGRAGIPRVTGYVTTLISYVAMCVAAALVSGVLAPFIAVSGALSNGASLSWGWLMIALIPIGLAVVHPAVLGRILALGDRLTKGRVPLRAPAWTTMLRLIAWSVPTWVLAGAAYVCVTAALGYHQNVAQVGFAAIAAWILGFLAIPVPAGAGVREIVFAAAGGLAYGPAVAVAAIARVLFILVDALGGVLGLLHTRRTAARRAGTTPTPTPAPFNSLETR